MTTLELESRKALLVREILTEVNDEDTFKKLNACFQNLKKETNNLPALSAQLLEELMNKAEEEDRKGLCITSDELKKEIQSW